MRLICISLLLGTVMCREATLSVQLRDPKRNMGFAGESEDTDGNSVIKSLALTQKWVMEEARIDALNVEAFDFGGGVALPVLRVETKKPFHTIQYKLCFEQKCFKSESPKTEILAWAFGSIRQKGVLSVAAALCGDAGAVQKALCGPETSTVFMWEDTETKLDTIFSSIESSLLASKAGEDELVKVIESSSLSDDIKTHVTNLGTRRLMESFLQGTPTRPEERKAEGGSGLALTSDILPTKGPLVLPVDNLGDKAKESVSAQFGCKENMCFDKTELEKLNTIQKCKVENQVAWYWEENVLRVIEGAYEYAIERCVRSCEVQRYLNSTGSKCVDRNAKGAMIAGATVLLVGSLVSFVAGGIVLYKGVARANESNPQIGKKVGGAGFLALGLAALAGAIVTYVASEGHLGLSEGSVGPQKKLDELQKIYRENLELLYIHKSLKTEVP